jgi:iron-sulfur cluster assembly accessory protein
MLSLTRRRLLLPSSSVTGMMARRFQPFSAEPIAATTMDSKTPSVRRRRTIDPIVVTDSAAQRLKELLDRNAEGAVGIRLGTKKRGCNGLSYTLNYVKEVSDKDEPLTTSNGVKVFIEPMALMNVIGTTMDWVETELSAEFTFTNPNSKGECGCGESFNV